mgnify:CR=1 FL=1
MFEGSVYAGDTRVLDLQQDEERLVSYAIDLGTEIVACPTVREPDGLAMSSRNQRLDAAQRSAAGGRLEPDALAR